MPPRPRRKVPRAQAGWSACKHARVPSHVNTTILTEPLMARPRGPHTQFETPTPTQFQVRHARRLYFVGTPLRQANARLGLAGGRDSVSVQAQQGHLVCATPAAALCARPTEQSSAAALLVAALLEPRAYHPLLSTPSPATLSRVGVHTATAESSARPSERLRTPSSLGVDTPGPTPCRGAWRVRVRVAVGCDGPVAGMLSISHEDGLAIVVHVLTAHQGRHPPGKLRAVSACSSAKRGRPACLSCTNHSAGSGLKTLHSLFPSPALSRPLSPAACEYIYLLCCSPARTPPLSSNARWAGSGSAQRLCHTNLIKLIGGRDETRAAPRRPQAVAAPRPSVPPSSESLSEEQAAGRSGIA